jgi:hypothetical protein
MDGTSLLTLQQPQQLQQPSQMIYKHDDEYIKNISKEILDGLENQNISLDERMPKKSKEPKNSNEKDIHEKKHFINSFFKTHAQNIKDFFIIVVAYIILSTETARTFIGSYVSCINPNEEGVVGFNGILTYGIILALLFIIIRIFV